MVFFINRYACFDSTKTKICDAEGSLSKFADGYNFYGYHIQGNGDIVWREWAPAAKGLYLYGDFSESSSQSLLDLI